ncbi:type III secretion apparatus protein [Stigmatella hybrida]|uniref:type III secretion apparatus protein n=1 Tax=Stigmatella hybrida TaxID=394097 RepID=UPI001CDA624F|nr:type III secretion apparatus protein [Stigmatella hybrida]
MAIDKIGSVGSAGAPLSPQVGKERFAEVLEGMKGPEKGPGVGATGCPSPPVPPAPVAQVSQAEQMLERVGHAQQELDRILVQAESGRSFSPLELLAFQARVYRASQEVDLAGKVLEKATSGVKLVLQTQV